jgi:hypothetical protein
VSAALSAPATQTRARAAVHLNAAIVTVFCPAFQGKSPPGRGAAFRNEHAAVQNQIPVTCKVFFIAFFGRTYALLAAQKSRFFRKNHAGSPFYGGASRPPGGLRI